MVIYCYPMYRYDEQQNNKGRMKTTTITRTGSS